MRLTLRTLLAWMDGTLEPAQQAEITARVNALPSASSLVARIQRLREAGGSGAPSLKGVPPASDPNLVASYLDNTLPSAAVVEFERICLDSDQQLLEVAASHQVLARVAKGPVQVPRRLRERGYGLGPTVPAMAVDLPAAEPPAVANTPAAPPAAASRQPAVANQPSATTVPGPSGARQSSPPAAVTASAATQRSTAPSSPEVTSLDATLPEFLRERPASRWPWVAVGGLILAAWLGLAIRTSPWGRRLGLSPATPGQPGPGAPAGGSEVAASNVANAADPGAAATTGADAPHPAGAEPEENSAESPTGGSPQMPTTALDPLNDDLPNRFERSAPGKAAANPAESDDNTPPPERPAPPPRVRVAQFVSPEGFALAWEPDRPEWFLLPDRAELYGDSQIVVPPGFDAALVIPGGQVQVAGGSRLAWSSGENGAPPVCRLDLGRMTVRASGNDAGPPLVALLELANQLWRLELPPGVMVSIEVTPVSPTEVEQPVRTRNRSGRIHLGTGQAQLTRLSDEPQTVTLEGSDTLELSAGPLVTDPAERRQQLPAGSADWSETPRRMTLSAKSSATQFRKLFTPGEGVEEGLLGAATGTEPRLSELATATLGLIGKSESLVAILQATRHGDARLQAIAGLRRSLLEDEFHRELIREALSQRFAPAVAEQVERLLWGYTVAEARTVEATTQLLEALNSPEIAVRELAITHLREMTGRDFDYQASGSEMQRSSAARAWRQLVNRNGGTVLKAVQPPAPNDDP